MAAKFFITTKSIVAQKFPELLLMSEPRKQDLALVNFDLMR
jgi:hypothetical protein